MKKQLYSFVLLLASAAMAAAQSDLSSPLPTDESVKVGKLSNGLTYYIKKNAKPEKKVELRLVVNAGSALEREDQQGAAHFLEHMAFNGTKSYKKNSLISYLQSIGVQFGADLNAFTSFDETVYILPISTDSPKNFDTGLQILGEWASDITLDPAEIDHERGVVLEEMRLGQGAGRRMLDQYMPKLLNGSKYAERLPIGKKEIIQRISREALLDFYADWYRPDLMAVVAVGDLDVAATERKIGEIFAGMKAKRPAKPRPEIDVPEHANTLTSVAVDKEAQLASVSIYLKKASETVKTRADYKRQVLNSFYTGMLNSRMGEKALEPEAPYMNASAGFGALSRTRQAYVLSAFTEPSKVRRALAAIVEENRRAKEFGFTAGELERQKVNYMAALESSYKERSNTESATFAAEYVATFLHHHAIVSTEAVYKVAQEIIPAITLEEVNAVGKGTVSERDRVVIIGGLDKGDGSYPNEAEILSLIRGAETSKLTPYSDNAVSGPLVEKMETNAKIVEERSDVKFGLTYWKLSNGVKVVLKPTDFQADEIVMNGFSPGGLSLADDKRAMAAEFASRIAGESGVKSLSSIQLDKALTGKNASAYTYLSDMHEHLSGSSTQKDFETMLQLAYLRFTDVNFDKQTFDTFISKRKAVYADVLSDPGTFFNLEVSRVLSQDHPRANRLPTLAELESISLEDVKAVYKERFADASDFTFVFVGNFDIGAVRPLIVKYLGGLPSMNRVEKGRDLGIRPQPGKLDKVVYKGSDQKSNVQIVFTGEAKYDRAEDRHLSILGELLTNKLIEILREEKAGVYGASASGGMSRAPYESYSFTVSFPCGPENVKALVEAAMAEIAKIQGGQLTEGDLEKVKQARIIGIRSSAKNNSVWSGDIEWSLRVGEPLSTQAELEARINAVTLKDLQSAAKKYLKADERKLFVLMPESSRAANSTN
jgi:zinc protease